MFHCTETQILTIKFENNYQVLKPICLTVDITLLVPLVVIPLGFPKDWFFYSSLLIPSIATLHQHITEMNTGGSCGKNIWCCVQAKVVMNTLKFKTEIASLCLLK